MNKSTTIAVDLAKSVFEGPVSERPGRVTERHQPSRTGFLRLLAEQRPATAASRSGAQPTIGVGRW